MYSPSPEKQHFFHIVLQNTIHMLHVQYRDLLFPPHPFTNIVTGIRATLQPLPHIHTHQKMCPNVICTLQNTGQNSIFSKRRQLSFSRFGRSNYFVRWVHNDNIKLPVYCRFGFSILFCINHHPPHRVFLHFMHLCRQAYSYFSKYIHFIVCCRVQKFPAWHTKAAPNGKCCEGYIVPSMSYQFTDVKSVLK